MFLLSWNKIVGLLVVKTMTCSLQRHEPVGEDDDAWRRIIRMPLKHDRAALSIDRSYVAVHTRQDRVASVAREVILLLIMMKFL